MNQTHEEHLHYLKILQKGGAIYQPEIRYALQYAIWELEKKKKERIHPWLGNINNRELIDEMKTRIERIEKLGYKMDKQDEEWRTRKGGSCYV